MNPEEGPGHREGVAARGLLTRRPHLCLGPGGPTVSLRGHVRLRPGWLPHLVRHHWTSGCQGSAPFSHQTGLGQDQDAGLRAAFAGVRLPDRKGEGTSTAEEELRPVEVVTQKCGCHTWL